MSYISLLFRISVVAVTLSVTLLSASLMEKDSTAGKVARENSVNRDKAQNMLYNSAAKDNGFYSEIPEERDFSLQYEDNSFEPMINEEDISSDEKFIEKQKQYEDNSFEPMINEEYISSDEKFVGKQKQLHDPGIKETTVSGKTRERRSLNEEGLRNPRLRGALKSSGPTGQMNLSLPQTADPPASCVNRCAEEIYLPCSCDVTCFVYKTCCEDISTACPSLEQEARIVMGDKLVDGIDHVTCVSEVFMVSKCNGNETDPLLAQTNDFIEFLKINTVVYDNVTGLVFRNKDIYKCYGNDTDSLLPWTTQYGFYHSVDYIKYTDLWQHLTPGAVYFKPPPEAPIGHWCTPLVITSCGNSSMDPDNKCGKFFSYQIKPEEFFYPLREIYGNEHCYQCSTNRKDGINAERRLFSLNRRSLSFRMNITDENSYTMDIVKQSKSFWKRIMCTFTNSSSLLQTHPYMKSKPICRIVMCEGEAHVVNGTCMVTNKLHIWLGNPPTTFDTSVIIDFSKMLVCQIEQLQWLRDPPYIVEVEAFSLILPEDTDANFSTVLGNVSTASFFSVHFDVYASVELSPWIMRSQVYQMSRWFYMWNNYVRKTDSKYLVYNEYLEQNGPLKGETESELFSAEQHLEKKYFMLLIAKDSKRPQAVEMMSVHGKELVREEYLLCSKPQKGNKARSNAPRMYSNVRFITISLFVTTLSKYYTIV